MMRAIFLAFVATLVAACSTGPHQIADIGPFPEARNAMEDVDAAAASARENGKLLLIVIGGDWCHDSKAFVRHLRSAAAKNVAQGYETVLVNVGYYETGDQVMQRWGGSPLFTHTPTVLIVDPATDVLLNWADHHQWRDAHSLGEAALVEYLGQDWRAAARVPWDGATPAMQAITAFETAQLERVRAAYDRLGPKLRVRSDDLDAEWKPVSALRYALPDDMLALRQAVHARQSMGEAVDPNSLDFPDYPPFTWE